MRPRDTPESGKILRRGVMLIEFQYPVFDPPLGGVENYIIESAAALRRLGHECQVFTGPPRKDTAVAPEFPVFRHPALCPSGLKLFFRPLAELANLKKCIGMDRPRPDIVVARFPQYVIAARDFFPPSTRVIYLPAEEMALRQSRAASSRRFKERLFAGLFVPQWQKLEKAACNSCDVLATLSKNLAGQMRPYTDRTIKINSPGINPEKFRRNIQKRRTLRDQYGIPDEIPVIVSAGRLSAEKNFSFGIKVMAEIKTGFKWLIAGAGNLLVELKDQAHADGLSERVIFLGQMLDMGSLYSAGDIFFHPAISEPFGHVLLEAMAAGLPIVAGSGRNGKYRLASEEIVPSDCGILISPENIDECAGALLRLIENRSCRDAMSRAGMSHATRNYSWSTHVNELIKV